MVRLSVAIFVAIVLVTFLILGWRGMRSPRPPLHVFPDMVVQPKYEPQDRSDFFADERTMRLPPEGTVAWGRETRDPDPVFATSDAERYEMQTMPIELDLAALQRGQEGFNIHCAVCHGADGSGNGITTKYQMLNPPTYHSDRLRQMSDGLIYQTITEGKGTMGPYGGRLSPTERWEIVAYVRALQRSHDATLDDVPEAVRQELESELEP